MVVMKNSIFWDIRRVPQRKSTNISEHVEEQAKQETSVKHASSRTELALCFTRTLSWFIIMRHIHTKCRGTYKIQEIKFMKPLSQKVSEISVLQVKLHTM